MPLILVVEDDVVSRLLISETVKKLGHTAIKAANGKIALSFLKENPDEIKLVITDLMMSQMDGYTLIDEIKKDEKFKHIPIIVQSAYLGVKATTELMKKGIEYFVPKPIDLNDLEEYIKLLM